MKTEPEERSTCSYRGASFSYVVARFAGYPTPKICKPCHTARLDRLVEAVGTIADVRNVGALLEVTPGGPRFSWTWSARTTTRPQIGSRYRFTYDPQERPAAGRFVVARGVRPLPEGS